MYYVLNFELNYPVSIDILLRDYIPYKNKEIISFNTRRTYLRFRTRFKTSLKQWDFK